MKSKLQLMFCFSSLAVICLFFISADAQGIGDRNRPSGNGTYRIVGRVLMPNGEPASNVPVGISSMELSSGSSSTTTDADGNFDFSGLSSGNYSVTARPHGLSAESESLTIAEGVTGGQPFNVVIYLRNAGQKKGDFYSANPLFKDVPKEALDKFKKASDKVQANDAKGAVPLYEAAIAAYPNFAAAYYELGHAYVRMNELDKALAAFVKAIELKPDYSEAKYYVGYTHFLKGTDDELRIAAAIFDDVLKAKDTPDVHYYLGITLARLHYPDPAIVHLKAALAKKDNESTALAHRTLGAIYIEKKQNAEAAAELQRYLTLVPKAPDADKLKAAIADLKKGS
jgi:Flp pilus assembly protein TadD